MVDWDLVWVISFPTATPKRKAGTVEVYDLQEHGLNQTQILGVNELPSGEGALSGFSMPVADLFDYES